MGKARRKMGTDRRRRFVIRVRGFWGLSMIWKEERLAGMRSQTSGEVQAGEISER